MDELYFYIGKRISEIRRANNITQLDLANRMDISVKHCSFVECGKAMFSLKKLVQFCDMFGVDLNYLVRGRCASGKDTPVIPQIVVDVMSSDNEYEKDILFKYLKLYKKQIEDEKAESRKSA